MGICVKEALKLIFSLSNSPSYEIIPIENAGGRISAEDIKASIALPTFNNSAMDGYGVKLSDASKKVTIIDTIFAGDKHQPDFNSTQCIKIMTGARVPKSVEAIVPFEQTQKIDSSTIKLPNKISKNQHIRFLGEDISKGETILQRGDEINFAIITLLSSQGISHIKVYKKPRVAIFSSGEELKLHYEQKEDYQIYNSNTPTLIERVKELGADVTFKGVAKDNLKSLQEIIKNSLDSNLIITSGGISVGEADFTKKAFELCGMEIIFDGIKIKPGKPTLFGKIKDTYVLNLPGNPLAAALIFEIFGKSILQKLSGSKDIFLNTIHTKLNTDFKNKKGRTTIIPGWFNGEYFEPSQKRSPGMVGVLHKCNSMMVLDEYCDFIKKETPIKILPINWKFFTNKQQDFFN